MAKNSHHELFKKTSQQTVAYTNRTYRVATRNADFLDKLVMEMRLRYDVKFSRNEVINHLIERLQEGVSEDQENIMAEAAKSEDAALEALIDLAFAPPKKR